MLKLRDSSPICKGGHRLVFEQPDDEGALVKVQRESVLARKSRLKRWFYRRSAFYHRYTPIASEVTDYLALRAHHVVHPPFIPHILGFAETDFGLGLVVTKMRGRDGGLAPALNELIRRDGMTAKIRDHLRIFCEALYSSGIIVSDLSLKNILLAYDDDNGERLVLVDGFGEKTLVPVNRISAVVNRLNCRRHIRNMMARAEAYATSREDELDKVRPDRTQAAPMYGGRSRP